MNVLFQEIPLNSVQKHLLYFKEQISIPKEYYLLNIRKIDVNAIDAYLFRFIKKENNTLLSEHFSFIITVKSFIILGFTNMDLKYANKEMISKNEAEIIALKFINKIDSSLSNDLENLWIDKHSELIQLDNKEIIVSGIKYKCYNSKKGDYTWVVVGFDGSIITYERNVIWHTKEKKRVTNKWLHDNWIKQNKHL